VPRSRTSSSVSQWVEEAERHSPRFKSTVDERVWRQASRTRTGGLQTFVWSATLRWCWTATSRVLTARFMTSCSPLQFGDRERLFNDVSLEPVYLFLWTYAEAMCMASGVRAEDLSGHESDAAIAQLARCDPDPTVKVGRRGASRPIV